MTASPIRIGCLYCVQKTWVSRSGSGDEVEAVGITNGFAPGGTRTGVMPRETFRRKDSIGPAAGAAAIFLYAEPR